MVPVHSGLSLTVAGTTSGSQVVPDRAVGLSGTPNQRWRLDFTGDTVAQIRSEGVAQNCMEPSATGAGGGTVIAIRQCADPDDQGRSKIIW